MKKMILLLILSTFLFFGCTEIDENLEKEELILNSLEKQLNFPETYQISYLENVQNTNLNIQLFKEDKKLVITNSEIDTKWIFLDENENYVCEQLREGEIKCGNVTADTRFNTEINSADNRFITKKITKEAIDTFGILIESKVLDFKGDILNKTIGERSCNEIVFQINYKDLSAEKLSKIGLSSSNPIVNKYKNFTQTVCYDEGYGMPLYIKLNYLNEGEEISFERTLIHFEDKFDYSIFELPGEEKDLSEFYTYFVSARNELNTIVYCRESEEKDDCFKQSSYNLQNSNLCDYIEDKTKMYQCLIIALTYDKNPTLCEKIQTSEDKDACYFELTRNTGDKTYCDNIIDDTIETMCLELNVSIPKVKIECETDEDCSIQGCNGEKCVPINESIMTICEWKDIYGCYSQNITSCKCINNSCTWELTSELIDCIDEYESKETLARIKKELNTNRTNEETEE